MSTELADSSKAVPGGDHTAVLGLGSNVDPARHLRLAIRRLREVVVVEAVSTAWQSPAVGSDGPDYVNAAVLVRTPMRKEWLMARLKEIEDELGRMRTQGQPARLKIDIDIVVFDSEICENDLWIQAYRAVPVAELLPELAAALPIKPRPEILRGLLRAGTSRNAATHSTRTPTP
jgi:2-amino-4-hydroxy-6-hydroxymethyldihydropteridine diphosphokinase